MNSSNNNRVSFISGLPEDAFEASTDALIGTSTAGNCSIGVGLNSTSVMSRVAGGCNGASPVNLSVAHGEFSKAVQGFNYFQALEYVQTSGASFASTNSLGPNLQGGLSFSGKM